MDKETLQREKEVVLYGQSVRFRVVKYAILIPLVVGIYFWKGWGAVGIFVGAGAVIGITLHFVLRYLTDGWRKSWGPYKTMFPEEK